MNIDEKVPCEEKEEVEVETKEEEEETKCDCGCGEIDEDILTDYNNDDSPLRKKSRSIDIKKDRDVLDAIIHKLKHKLIKSHGIGLSAPQISENIRVFAIKIPGEPIRYFVNPIIKPLKKKGIMTNAEGCLSVPNETYVVDRYYKIKITHLDETMTNKSISAHGLLSAAIQHENDHLEGRLICDIGKKEDVKIPIKKPTYADKI